MKGFISFVALFAWSAVFAAQPPAAAALDGAWIAETKTRGVDNSDSDYARVRVEQRGESLTIRGAYFNLSGTIRGRQIDLSEPHPFEGQRVYRGEIVSGEIRLTNPTPFGENDIRIYRESASTGAPRTHDFSPTVFHRQFRSDVAPALRIGSGDTVRTWTVDSTGKDSKGRQLSAGGNPQTGPFFVEGALPGDVLKVQLKRIRLNRDTAVTTAYFIASTVTPTYYDRLAQPEFGLVYWQLDRAAGVARLANETSPKLRNFTVPLKPMIGGIGVAPEGYTAIRANGLGRFGGNLDYNRLVEGTTLYLPVAHPGAFLFLGDGHAAQGDGELAGNGLETSLDVELTVEVLPGRQLSMPRLESDEFRMAMGIGGSLQVALQEATTNMGRWLEEDYGLNTSEKASVLGTSMIYDIAEVVDGEFNVVARISKAILGPIPLVKETAPKP
jgi:amidase